MSHNLHNTDGPRWRLDRQEDDRSVGLPTEDYLRFGATVFQQVAMLTHQRRRTSGAWDSNKRKYTRTPWGRVWHVIHDVLTA
jgi:uncharacterized protein YaeQ